MVKITGYGLTIFYLIGVFFPAGMSAAVVLISQLAGHVAFALFALLLARGARRTTNHFLYFARLLVIAVVVEGIEAFATAKLDVYFPERNAVFTYAAGLALIAGISMTIGCYRDLVAHAVPAGGEMDRNVLFGVPVNPGQYKIAPGTGLIIGLATAGLAVFVTLFFHFAYGLYGLLTILLMFIALRDDGRHASRHMRKTLYRGRLPFSRALCYTVALNLVALILAWLIRPLRTVFPTTYVATLLAHPLAAGIPEPATAPNGGRRWFTWTAYPLMMVVLTLIRAIAYGRPL